VLQSNFRGSGGFGADWSGEGGFRDWRTAIGDVNDGARHVVSAGVADPERICILGWSYGGYAALLAALEEPGLYRCIVSIAGVTDLPLLIDHMRDYSGWRRVREFIGRDDDVLERGSPLRRVAEIAAPVLLFHGDRDINVRIDHGRRLAKALEAREKPVEFVEYEGAEHGIWRNRFRIDMLERIGRFLERNTRPRDPAQPAAAPPATRSSAMLARN
jgi:dipeptidyl aminopeptidase/acylaminoacyl peptidase